MADDGYLVWLRVGSGTPVDSWTPEQVNVWWESSYLPPRPAALHNIAGAVLATLTSATLLEHGLAPRVAAGVAATIQAAVDSKPPPEQAPAAVAAGSADNNTGSATAEPRTAEQWRAHLGAVIKRGIATSLATEAFVRLTLGYSRAERDDDGRTFYVNMTWSGQGEALDAVSLEIDYGGDARPYRIDDGYCQTEYGADVDAFLASDWGAALIADALIGNDVPEDTTAGPPPVDGGTAAWHGKWFKEPFPSAYVSLIDTASMMGPNSQADGGVAYLTRGQHLLAKVERDYARCEAEKRAARGSS